MFLKEVEELLALLRSSPYGNKHGPLEAFRSKQALTLSPGSWNEGSIPSLKFT